ncbi:MAG: endonuclease [Synergistaceae bacterium]|nr:endonuclease [Synergistaceae bacterium]
MLLGIDPGNNKCGWALVNFDGLLYASGIVPSHMPAEWFEALSLTGKNRINSLRPWIKESSELHPDERVTSVILGTGTGSKKIWEQLKYYYSESSIISAEEKFTTLKARGLYWKLHPPRGLWSFLPLSLLTPPRDIDDLAAWAIVLHKIETEKGE